MPIFSPFISSFFGASALALLHALYRALKGKKFAIIGPMAAGKTTFVNFLLEGSISGSYRKTISAKKINGRRFKLKDLELDIDPIMDVPGEKAFHPAWEGQVRIANVVCYLFDASLFALGDERYIDQVTQEMRHVNRWRKERYLKDSALQFFIIATHMDRIPEYRNADEDGRAHYVAGMWEQTDFKRLERVGGGSRARCLAGSLASEEGCEQLVECLIREVVNSA